MLERDAHLAPLKLADDDAAHIDGRRHILR
jgi:hypothetical protein